MLITPYAVGAPIWVDLHTPDLVGAAAFYRALFGWEYPPAGPGAGGYGFFRQGAGTVAGAMEVDPGRAPPSWSLYFATPDAEATAEAVRRRGGSVADGPRDVADLGRTAVCADPGGAGFSLWQPGTNAGLDVVNSPGGFCWTELYASDEDVAYAFYGAVFGWQALSVPLPDGSGTYRMVNPAGQGPEGMFGGFVPLGADPAESGGAPYWLLYFAVTDCEATVTAARELGGGIRVGATDIEGVGRFAKLSDPYGARFALMEGARRDA
ncbi:VOC family protein [Streptomyces corynorhini]|uniref:VOC family protein n=1 Tax=Streptomyces corynorhini TaxID=2282652 RepID=A0A370BH54_9ACTN|nr:VOC family protein [Streptomyces corynorhini]RDG39594.1 VOC family protein [Streptomyces corynorhini]